MKTPAVHPVVAAATLFLVVSTVTEVGLAGMYVRGVTRLRSAPSIVERDVRILARPVRVAVGQLLPRAQVEGHLRRIGWYPACEPEPGCYAAADDSLTIWSRYPELPNVTLQWSGDTIAHLRTPGGEALEEAAIEPETILTMKTDPGGTITRTSNDPIPFRALVDTPLADAIIASEDRWFLRHHGLDFRRLALIPVIGGGASTITMQVARLNVLEDRSRTLERKFNEIGIAMAIERLHSKPEILSAYVNSVYLGASRGRVLHGFGAAARAFFGVDDIRLLTDLQAATLVALLNQPSRYLGDLHDSDDARLRRQRNRVLRLMQHVFPDRYSEPWVRALEHQPVAFSIPAASTDVHAVSRHYLDHALTAQSAISQGRIYLTLDPDLQRIAAEVVEQGLTELERRLPRLATPQLQAALIVTNPHTGDVLAMIGGRSYDDSQFNRASSAQRQLGSIMKPFDYLAAFERAAAEKRTDISPDTRVLDRPAVFAFAGYRPWKPANYDHDYAGMITWRRALAESRNVATVKVATWAGVNRVAALWEAASGQSLRQIFPSITLGAIQATMAEVARAYAIFATGGIMRPLRTTVEAIEAGRPSGAANRPAVRVAREDTTRVVADMMRSVLDEGTARGARGRGFTLDAAGKTGTTDGLRDAWFAGFTPDLLAVVWVGRDDDQPLGLTGAQAALPIWTDFMKRALPNSPSSSTRFETSLQQPPLSSR